jgi:hypothetical protein
LPQEKIPAYFWENFGDYLERISRGNEKLKKELDTAFKTLTQYFSKFYQKWNLLQENKGCYRLLASDNQQFLKRLFSPYLKLKELPESDFLEDFFGSEIWLGRIFPEDKKSCTELFPKMEEGSKNFSFTLTCQNWQSNSNFIYVKEETKTAELPYCYNSSGLRVTPLGIGGISKVVFEKEDKKTFEVLGRRCGDSLRILCVEQ